MKTRRTALALLAAAAIATAATAVPPALQALEDAPAERAPAAAPLGVGCQGRVMPRDGHLARLAAPADQGTPIVARLLVAEGAQVAAGDALAVLAAEEPARLLLAQAEAEQKTAAAAVETARAALAETAAGAGRIRADAALLVLDARAALAEAEGGRDASKAPSARFRASAEEVAAAAAARDAARENLARLNALGATLKARLDAALAAPALAVEKAFWDADKKNAAAALAETRAANALALAEHEGRVAAAGGELAVLEARLAAVAALAKIHEREPAEHAAAGVRAEIARERVTAAGLQARAAEKEADAAVERARRVLAEAELALEKARAAAQLAGARFELTRIKAPFAGTVLRVFAHPGEAVGPQGVLELADLSRMTVETEVAVADIGRVRAGDTARVRVPGVAGALTGKVVKIGGRVTASALADENPTALKDLRVVRVVVEISPADVPALRHHTGAQVLVRIGGK
ncbi:MAG: HlyD family efflux transporter periplasmic adaptor subunit [Puniceicoccales bacterium]|jgi:HlyD family secretion protein|nr:HlyD family efflux transporter periplasmic adaptor subunit [Puniceicoccales bacterium]